MAEKLLFKRLHVSAVLPKKQTVNAAGYDLSSVEDVLVPAGKCKLIDIGWAMTVPKGTYGRIAPRSSVSCKNIMVNAGVIDRDYTGKVKVLLSNLGDTDFIIKTGDRIAQLILEVIQKPDILEVESLEDTERGSGGFGSTGV